MSTATENMGSARPAGIPRLGLLLEFFFLLAALALLVVAPGHRSIQTLSLVFASIILEAFPFMLFGAMVGGLIEVFVSRERMTSLLPKRHPWLAVFIAAGLGGLFPVCECAVVPVVRRLTGKGLPAGAAIAYLLGGPIANPIVAASTALAYKFDGLVVLMRLGLGYLIAVTVGLAMVRLFRGDRALLPGLRPAAAPTGVVLPLFHPHADDASCGCGHHHGAAPLREKLLAACRHATDDFLAVGHFLVIGAFIAALAQTYIDRSIFLGFAGHFGLPSTLMMTLAILLNLCSEADAFIAASFRGLVPLPAQLAFLLTGPMLDLKLLLMYQSLFRKRAILALAVLILAAVLTAALGLEFVMGGDLA